MIFNSLTFLAFGLLFIPLYWSVPARLRNPLLLVGSYVFYGWWDWRFLGLLAFSTVVDFNLGRLIHTVDSPKLRGQLLWVSVCVNLGILGVFKYFNFFVDSLVEAGQSIGVDISSPALEILLPVGISFYTFQTISYSFDIHRRRIEPTDSLISFATYVAFFPQLVAGPIERAQTLLPQIDSPEDREFPAGPNLNEAARLILGGLAKKVVIADGAATVANQVFEAPADHSWLYVAVGVVAFGLQIYGDFAGYSDIARGVSMLLGISLVVNFTEPYLSRNITEFWRRWHISLSNWLRDYLYIPLGGNRGGELATYRNLLLTMLLGGLWHGASWNFVVWGGLHGLYLLVHKAVTGGAVSAEKPRLSELPQIVGTFVAVHLAWVFFRAEDFGEAWTVLSTVVTLKSGITDWASVAKIIVLAAVVLAQDLWQRELNRSEMADSLSSISPLKGGVLAGLAIGGILLFSGATPQPFIYFQF